MSSHHVIRDEQEPPLFILHQSQNVALLKQLLGWSPSVWVMEPVAEWVMSLDVKIDGVLTIEPEKHQNINQQIGEYSLALLKEEDVFGSIYQVLAGKEYTGIHIFCDSNQRDELLKKVSKQIYNLPVTLITDFETNIIIKKTKFRKWYSKGTQLQILKGELSENDNLERVGENYLIKNEGIVQINSKDSIIILKEI